jgi:hypothetical protein
MSKVDEFKKNAEDLSSRRYARRKDALNNVVAPSNLIELILSIEPYSVGSFTGAMRAASENGRNLGSGRGRTREGRRVKINRLRTQEQ